MESLDCCFSNLKNRLDPSKIAVIEVFADEFYRDCSITIEFFALQSVPPSKIFQTVQIINKHFPVDTAYNYLKKIRNGSVIIAPVREGLDQRLDDLLIALGSANLLTEEITIEKIPVPKFPVLTHEQFAIANKIWPIRVTTPLTDIWMEPDSVAKEKICNRLNCLINIDNPCATGACIFISPSSEELLEGFSQTNKNPLNHAVIDACNKVGKVSDYLATGFHVFCLGEPCVMCSMALLHSRVAEVYFIQTDGEEKKFHGLGSTVSIHCNPQLNHRFRVFRVKPLVGSSR